MKLQKAAVTALTLVLCLIITSCGTVNSEFKKGLSAAQEGFSALDSGKIMLTATSTAKDQVEVSKTEFTYLYDKDGILSYCVQQFDGKNTLLYMECNDGEKSEEWLLGSGFSTYDSSSENFTQYTREKLFKYLKLFSRSLDSSLVKKSELIPSANGQTYQIDFNVNKVNQKDYPKDDLKLQSKTCSYLTTAANELIGYREDCIFTDANGVQQNEYLLDTVISQQNKIKEIKKPVIQ